jgi:hypothetical protein
LHSNLLASRQSEPAPRLYYGGLMRRLRQLRETLRGNLLLSPATQADGSALIQVNATLSFPWKI